MEIILFQPEIPQNTGNIVRTCACTGATLTLVRPLGFSITDRALKRAGLDYWEGVAVNVIDNLAAYLQQKTTPFFFFSSKAKKTHFEANFTPNCSIIFGNETSGLDPFFFDHYPEQFLTIPMIVGKRCLNLASSVAIATYEVIRQNQISSLH